MDKTCFIYIHGVQSSLKTHHISGYSKKFHKDILRELKRQGRDVSRIKRYEINWAPVTFHLKTGLAKLQFDKIPKRGGLLSGAARNLIYPAVIDILYYVKDKGSIKTEEEMLVMKKLHGAVARAKKVGFKKVIVFAHSLGSVVAYDYIFRFSKSKKFKFPTNLKLSALVTFGSPIALFASGMGYPLSTKLKKHPKYIKKWINFWDPHDLISGRMEQHFLKSFSKGFLKDFKVDTAGPLLPLKAHAGYWSHPRVIRKIAKGLVG